MQNSQSPHFSSSHKIDISSKLSPQFRNKRIPSSQDNCPNWNRANSCKKFESPAKVCEKNRKRSQNSQQRVKSKTNLSINHNIADQLNTLKNEYTQIKIAYQELIESKVKQDDQSNQMKQEVKKNGQENERLVKQNEKLRNKTLFLQMQVQRIRKQSMKLIQIEQFKTHKLQQNLLDKQKAISSFKQNFKLEQNVDIIVQYTADTDVQNNNVDNQNNSSIAHYESLTFSKDKTFNNSQFISISLTSMMESQDQFQQDFNSKKSNHVDTEKPIPQVKHIIVNDKILKPSQSNKAPDNFIKLRKEMSKKIEVNIFQRNKQNSDQTAIKNELDRKNPRSNKSSKSQLKRNDDENRSSKKKMRHK